MNILKDLTELVNENVISAETSDRIEEYYRNKNKQSTNWLFIVFGILGAVLVSLGIILILAHNWDELSNTIKTFLAFLPLVSGQILCGYTLLKKQDNVTWKESSTTFLFFSMGACLSLISQIYNIPGNLSSFLLTWMLLCLPLLYVMQSSVASLLYIIGITYYACEKTYWSYPQAESYLYWVLLLLALPHYYWLYKKKPGGNFMIFHNWLIPIAVIVALGTFVRTADEIIAIAYFSLFSLFYLIGNTNYFRQQNARSNGCKALGSMGTIVLLLMLSFDWFWQELRTTHFIFSEVIKAPELIVSVILSILAATLLSLQLKSKGFASAKLISLTFILFIVAFSIGLTSAMAVVLINLFVLAIGLQTINNGAKQDHLGILNVGLLIITALVICRFFDTDLSFVIRGALFLFVGIGFFVANYLMLKKRKINESL